MSDCPSESGSSDEDSSCLEAIERLDAYLDAELDELTAVGIARHLEHCGGCGSEFESLRELKQAVAESENGLDPEVVDRLRDFLATVRDHPSPA